MNIDTTYFADILAFLDRLPAIWMLIFIILAGQVGQFWGLVLSQWDLRKSVSARLATLWIGAILSVVVVFGGYRATIDQKDNANRDSTLDTLKQDVATASKTVQDVQKAAEGLLQEVGMLRSEIVGQLAKGRSDLRELNIRTAELDQRITNAANRQAAVQRRVELLNDNLILCAARFASLSSANKMWKDNWSWVDTAALQFRNCLMVEPDERALDLMRRQRDLMNPRR